MSIFLKSKYGVLLSNLVEVKFIIPGNGANRLIKTVLCRSIQIHSLMTKCWSYSDKNLLFGPSALTLSVPWREKQAMITLWGMAEHCI